LPDVDPETLWGPLLVETSRCAIHARDVDARCAALLRRLAGHSRVSPLLRGVAIAMALVNSEIPSVASARHRGTSR